MREWLRDREHMVRMGILFAGALAVFLVVRAVMVPKDFGTYGHFRTGALADNMAHPLVFAGRQACGDCHDDIVASRKGSKHEQIGCEACHGALEAHASADDPSTLKPTLPDGKTICLVCHRENVAKPAGFPQVDPTDHGDGGPCTSCHNPHHPEIS